MSVGIPDQKGAGTDRRGRTELLIVEREVVNLSQFAGEDLPRQKTFSSLTRSL